MNLPPGHRRPTEAEKAEDFAKRRRALEQAEREGTKSKSQLEAAWVELSSFEGYPREIISLRPAIQEQMDRITRAFARGLDEAAEKQVVASLRARGYLIARPADQLTDTQRKIAEQSQVIDVLRDTIATLRAGGSVPPSTSAER